MATSRTNEPITVDASDAWPLFYYYPQLTARARVVAVAAPNGPGWYVQKRSTFRAPAADFVLEQGDAVAAHVP